MRYLSTNEIVAPRTMKQGHNLRHLLREDIIPSLLILRDEEGSKRPDVRSYTAALRQRMERVRQAAGILGQTVGINRMAPVYSVPSRELIPMVRDANNNPDIDGILVMSPTQANYEEVVAEIDPRKDIDGMNPSSDCTPCTPKAIQQTLQYHGLWTPSLHYALVGRGRTVNSHVEAELRAMHKDAFDGHVRVITKSNAAELPDAMAVSDVAIVAAGVHHQIKPEMMREDMRAVVGVCIEDIHPDVYRLPHDTLVTPAHLDRTNWGIGANTSSMAVQRTLNNAAMRLPS